jgi:uncharacterized protein with beta-barrel porin domain
MVANLLSAIILASALAGVIPALADGGAGGASFGFGPSPGGTGFTGNPGTSGATGGGGGAGGGSGGNTLLGCGGGAGGTAGSPNGGNGSFCAGNAGGGGGFNGNGAGNPAALPSGTFTLQGGNGGNGANTSSTSGGGGGGGAGGYGAVLNGAGPFIVTTSSSIAGGNGGAGGDSNATAFTANGGGGGDGGIGTYFTGAGATLTVNSGGSITGGNGGNGGAGANVNNANGAGGNGGAGGIGVVFSNGGTLVNFGTIAGGNGGNFGVGGSGGGTPGANGSTGIGGVGVFGINVTVIDAGTIIAGFPGNSGARADAITFTGGSNTLQLQPGYNIVGNVVGTGGDAFQLGGSGSSNFSLSSFGSTQQYQGFATFSVVGGNWTLTGTNTTAVPFSVSNATATVNGTLNDSSATVNAGGVLVVNGSLSDPTINSGGILTGTGTVGPTQINSGGTFAPGNGTPGTSMTINGSLAFASGALYVVNLNPTTSSFATVTGTASLAGTVQANFAAGSYVAKQYTILTAAGGVTGTFSGISNVNLPSGATDSLSYTANGVLLNLAPGFTGFTGLNVNQQNVANALTNFFNTTGGVPAQFFGLTPGGLTQIDGEAATGAERVVFQLTNEFLGLMLDPFVNGRGYVGSAGGGAGFSAIGFAPEQQDNLPPDIALAYASILTKAPPQNFEQRWTAWGSAYGGANIANGNATVGSNNITASTYGFASGMDYHLTTSTVLGFALAGAGTNWGLANALGTGKSDALQAGAYGISWFGPAYLAGSLAFSNHWFTTKRSALGDALTADFVGQGYGGRLEGGYRYAMLPAFGVTPYGAVQFQDFHTPAYSETDTTGGGFGLSYNAMNATDVRTELGARFDDPAVVFNKPLVLFGRLAWAHDFVSNPTLSAGFEALPGGTFTVNGAPIPHDSALTTAGAKLFLSPNWTLLAKFEGEFGNGSQTYAGTGTLRYTW